MAYVASMMTNPIATMTTTQITINPMPIIPGIYCFIIILMLVYKYKDVYDHEGTWPLILLLAIPTNILVL